MNESIFFEVEFFALLICSLILPMSIYAYMLWTRAISQLTVLSLGVVLIVISAIDVFLLKRLDEMARVSASLLDDRIFSSEISIALYLLPIVFAGIGVNVISHVLITHLSAAERRYAKEHKPDI